MKEENISFGPGLVDGGSELSTSKTAFGELSVANFEIQAGWSFNYNINPDAITILEQNSATVTQEDSFAKIESGTDPAGFAFLRTKRALAYTPGVGALARFTAVFGIPQVNSIQLVGVGNSSDGWFFGYDGLEFGILKRRNGIDEWSYQADWNRDLYPGLNPQMGNVYEIRFQWLGFGMQYFGIEDDEGNVADVHQIKYANLYDQVSVFNPTLPIAAGVGNTGNTTNIILKTPSAIAGCQGEAYPEALTVPIGYGQTKAIPAAPGEQYLFSILNPQLYVGKDNRLPVDLVFIACDNDTPKGAFFKIISGAALTDPTFNDIKPGVTPLQVDEVATAITGGSEILIIPVGKVRDSGVIDLTPLKVKLNSENIISIVVETGGIGTILTSMTFRSRI